MSTLLRALAAGLILVLGQSLAAAATIKSMNIGNWSAGAYTDDQTGDFSHCAASSNYKNGISLFFVVNKDFAWSVAFSNPQWQMVKGSKYPVSLSIDGAPSLDETAVAISNNLVQVSLADNAGLFETFKHGNLLVLYAAGETFKFYLTDTSQVLPSLLECVNRFKQAAPPPQASANPFAAPAPTPAPAPPAPGAVDIGLARQAEATLLIANILAQSGVSGFQILTPEEAEKLKTDAAWRAGNAFGTMKIFSDTETKLEDMNASIIASDALLCHDKFFSGSMPDSSGSRLFTSCRSDKQTLTMFYSAIQRPKGGYYVLATGGTEPFAQGDGKPTRDLDNGIRTAAYRVVTH